MSNIKGWWRIVAPPPRCPGGRHQATAPAPTQSTPTPGYLGWMPWCRWESWESWNSWEVPTPSSGVVRLDCWVVRLIGRVAGCAGVPRVLWERQEPAAAGLSCFFEGNNFHLFSGAPELFSGEAVRCTSFWTRVVGAGPFARMSIGRLFRSSLLRDCLIASSVGGGRPYPVFQTGSPLPSSLFFAAITASNPCGVVSVSLKGSMSLASSAMLLSK